MNYYLDTEFIECFKKPLKWLPSIGNFNRPYHSLQLISICIVADDGREYYAVSREYNYNDANDWVKQNVLSHLGNTPKKTNKQIADEIIDFVGVYPPKFYAYYADYDWVLFCSLFGMMDLPKGFPMYCIDLKQTMDEVAEKLDVSLAFLKRNKAYPTQQIEHNALDDAKWNKKLHEFLLNVKF